MEKNKIFPELFILGAGPGDPELITVKGYKLLQQADVVLYDNLANKDLLAITKETCEKIYVGKQPYGDYTPQETINEMILNYAFTKGKVVRLKGGVRLYLEEGLKRSHLPASMALKHISSRALPVCKPRVYKTSP